MVSEPIVPEVARVCASNFAGFSSTELRRKIQRVAGHNQRRRESAADTWARWYLPAVREAHFARGLAAAWGPTLPPDGARVLVEDAERAVAVHATFVRHTLAMIPVNNAWIEEALAELKRRETL